MRKLRISITMILLGSIILSFLILPQFNKVLYDSSRTQLQTKDYDVQYDEDPLPPPDSPPKPSGLIHSKDVFNISASADDAWTRNNIVPPRTYYDWNTLHLAGINTLSWPSNRKICLRWNVSIPKNAKIINAYLNLTIQGRNNYNGFRSTILPFDSTSTPPFSNTNENIGNTRPRSYPGVNWQMPVPATINETYISPDIGSLVQRIVNREDWINNSIFGLYIQAGGLGAGVGNSEWLFFHSFDGPNHLFIPKLIIKWEETPAFTATPPATLTIQNQTKGYHLDWTPVDDNPLNYIITGNETLNGPREIVQSGNWTSGIVIRYDIPPIDIENRSFIIILYNMTIYDEDGKFENNTVLVTVDDIYPIIDIKFNQTGEAYSYLKRNYFETDKGPFTLQIYNNTPLTPTIQLYAYYPENHLELLTTLMLLGVLPVLGTVHIDEWTYYNVRYNIINTYSGGHSPTTSASVLKYNNESGCWLLTPTVGASNGLGAHNHTFQLAIELPPPWGGFSIYEYYGLPVQKLYYDLKNYFLIQITSAMGTEFIYNQTVYGGVWGDLIIDVLNKDLSPPLYEEPEFIEPEEPDLHYEINIFVYTEEKGAEIDEVYLYYKIDDGAWKKTEMVFENIKYYGEIPPQEGGAKITYYIEIVDIAGNIVTTDEFEETAVTFEEISPIIPILGILLAFLGALSLVVIFRYRSKRAFKKARAEKMIKKPKKDTIS